MRRLKCVSLLCLVSLCAAATAQQPAPSPVRLEGLFTSGIRSTLSEGWGSFEFTVSNFSDQDRRVRVYFFYTGQNDVQYGRELWLPARSQSSSWLLGGPIPPLPDAGGQPVELERPKPGMPSTKGREVQMLLYDVTDGTERLVLPRGGEQRTQSRLINYRPRDAHTCIYEEHEVPVWTKAGDFPPWPTMAEERHVVVQSMRLTCELSASMARHFRGLLPPIPEAFDGIDHFVVASERLLEDPVGLRALRQWAERGGRVWVMLDRVGTDVAAGLLGDAVDFQLLDRVRLSTFQLDKPAHLWAGEAASVAQRHENPVAFARVLLPDHERKTFTIGGYPVYFTRPLGRGKVVFTTLGPRGWTRPREPKDPPSPYENLPALPMPLIVLQALGQELHPAVTPDPFPVEAFRATLTEEIGYQVPGRATVTGIFAAFLAGVLGMGLLLRRVGRAEWLAIGLPVAGVVGAGLFVVLGESLRRQVPPTIALGQVVDAPAGVAEVSVRGLAATYRPEAGPAEIATREGGLFEVDTKGMEGPIRRLVLTDGDAWHWENVAVPAGVRLGTFQQTVPLKEPIRAVARFGPEGVEGKLTTGPFTELGEVLLRPLTGWTAGRDCAIRLAADGTFRCASADVLPQHQYLASTLLNDEQQRRQNLYRAFFDPNSRKKDTKSGIGKLNQSLVRQDAPLHLQGRNVLLAWAKPLDVGFQALPEARQVGRALLVVPVVFERPAPGTTVVIPGPFVSYQRVRDGVEIRPTLEGSSNADVELRFQLPREVLPLRVERVRVTFKIDAPGRVVVVDGLAEKGERVELHRSVSPLDATRAESADARVLRLDKDGGLHLNLTIREATSPEPQGKGPTSAALKKGLAAADDEQKWVIQYLEVEVTGKTLE